jgi:hypothetical protein
MAKYWYGTGAALARSVGADPLGIARVLAGLAGRWATGVSPVASSVARRPRRLLRLSAFTRGFAAGLWSARRSRALSTERAAA